jgi:hypothetical protein
VKSILRGVWLNAGWTILNAVRNIAENKTCLFAAIFIIFYPLTATKLYTICPQIASIFPPRSTAFNRLNLEKT